MPLPLNDELRRPILQFLSDGNSWRKNQLIEPLARHFHLTETDIAQEYDSGNGNIFADKISWVLSYHALCGLLSRPKRGYYQISELGKQYAQKDKAEIIAFVRKKMAERDKKDRAKNNNLSSSLKNTETEQNPRELLENSFHSIRQEIYDEILDTILSKSPYAFENLVMALLQKMGYGGKVENSGEVTKKSRDNGIDGIIREDVLGLGQIFIQAKRYARDKTVSRADIQSFAGAMNNTDKGVFITTARYSAGALEYAKTRANQRIVLINGQQLAEYIYRYDLGMQTEQTFSIKKLDSDFWDEMPDDKFA